MNEATPRQQQILNFIQKREQEGSPASLREIAAHFNFRSSRSAADHIDSLRKKGLLTSKTGSARSLRVVTPFQSLKKRVVDIPLYGSIPAGFADRRQQEADACITVDIETVGIKPSSLAFALRIQGDSMIGKYILDGDIALIEPRQDVRDGDVVAALVDGQSTLKTYVANGGKPYLRAENPKYKKIVPSSELVIDGVLVALIRKRK